MPLEPGADNWLAWRGRLAEANDPAFWPIEAIEQELIEGRALFLANGEAALVLRVVHYPGGARVLETIAGAGDMAALKGPLLEAAENYAKEQELTHLMVSGRQGWPRVFPDWRHYQSIIVRAL